MNMQAGHRDAHFRIPTSAVYVTAITIALIVLLELAARIVEYATFKTPTTATLEHMRIGRLPEADQLKAEHRFWGNYMRHDPYLVYSPIPGWSGRYTHFNSLGFRGAEVSARKPAQVLRVAVLGGSTAFGAFVKDERTFPAVLQDLLDAHLAEGSSQESGSRVEVVNAAVPGYVSTQEVIALQLKLLSLAPDLVIVFDGLNDVFVLGSPLRGTTRMEEWESQCTMPLSQRIRRSMMASSALLRAAQGVKSAVALRRQQPEPTWELPPGRFDDSVSVYLGNLKSMLAVLKSRNIAALTIIQPARLWSISELEMQAATHIPIERVRAMRAMHDVMKHAAADITGQPDMVSNMLDLDDIGAVPGSFIEDDDIHLTEAGSRAVAARIADFLVTHDNRF